jgi:hypothetical protein
VDFVAAVSVRYISGAYRSFVRKDYLKVGDRGEFELVSELWQTFETSFEAIRKYE